MPKLRREQWAIVAVVTAFIGLSFASSIINPLHEATDELRHFRFVRHIVANRSLPVQGQVGCSVQGHHPPLFYALAAAATAWIDTDREICHAPETNPFWGYRYWEVGADNKNLYLHGVDEAFPWSGDALIAHIARALNVLLGAGVVWVTWRIGRTIWPRRASFALGSTAFVAFNPMFVYMAGSINNDVIAALSGSLITLACVRLLQDDNGLSRRWGLVLGILYGLALLSKFNLAVIAILIEIGVTWVAWRKRQWRLWWQVNLLVVLFAMLIAGWWFVRNQFLYGEPTGFRRLTELWGVREPAGSWGLAISELPYAWTSLWGRFGYGQIPLPGAIYSILAWVVFLALAGTVVALVWRWIQHRRAFVANSSHLLLAVNAAIFFAVLFSYLLVSPAGPMGRFFFPALPSLAILIFFGLTQLIGMLTKLRILPRSTSPSPVHLAALTSIGMAWLTLIALFGYLAPAYARPRNFEADTPLPNPINVHFDTLAALRGYEIGKSTVHPGGVVDVTLYWEVTAKPPGNYLLFVHLIDEHGNIVAQRDTHPGLGNFPSKLWHPGDRFIEPIQMNIPETAYTPSTASLSIGLYAPGAYRLAVASDDGTPLGDSLVLGAVEVVTGGTEYPNPLDQNFNNESRLIGYAYNQRQLKPGDSLKVTLYWQSIQPTEVDYIIQVRLVDDMGTVLAAADSRPQEGRSPTTTWVQGQITEDEHTLILDPSLPAGSYAVFVAVVDSSTNQAQNIVAEDGHWIDNRLLLSRVRVQP